MQKLFLSDWGIRGIRVTMDTYGRAMRKADQEAANKIDHLFSKKGAK